MQAISDDDEVGVTGGICPDCEGRFFFRLSGTERFSTTNCFTGAMYMLMRRNERVGFAQIARGGSSSGCP
jgi:hypothetical protein